jgi:hypothetical protein
VFGRSIRESSVFGKARRASSVFSVKSHTEQYDNVGICSINIENFNQWCMGKSSKTILEVLIQYNSFVSKLVDKTLDVEKVELVRETILIVGGMNTKCALTRKNQIKCILLNICYKMIEKGDYIKKMFGDESISLRIGLHKGTVYRDSLNYRKKIKLFGKDLFVANYLDSVCKYNSINVSSQVYEIIKSDKLIQKLFHFQSEYDPSNQNHLEIYSNKNYVYVSLLCSSYTVIS